MGFSFMSINKIKSKTKLMDTYMHNFRRYRVENADPEKASENKEYILPPGATYLDMFDAEINKQRFKGIRQPIRKDAVRAIEVVATYTKDATTANIDVEEWVQNNIKWLNETFNEKGTDNVVGCMLHCDEPGNYHIHAVIIPMDNNGHLNASRYLDGGPKRFRELQASYGEWMQKCHGLERGVPKSVAKHSTVKKYLSRLNNPVGNELPDLYMGETAEEYFKRIQPIAEDSRLYHKRLELEYTTKLNQLSGNASQIPKMEFYTMLNGAVNFESWKPRKGEHAVDYRFRANMMYEKEMFMCQNRIINIKNQIDALENPSLESQIELAEKDAQIRALEKLVKEFSETGDLKDAKENLKKYAELEKALAHCKDEELKARATKAISELNTQYQKEKRHEYYKDKKGQR